MNEKLKKRLESDAKEIRGALDGDIAVMLQLLGGLRPNPESTEIREMLENEIKLIKKRVTWDVYAGEMGPKVAIRNYGKRP